MFTGFGVAPGSDKLNDDAIKATDYLLRELVPAFARNLLEADWYDQPWNTRLHYAGINMRHLGLIDEDEDDDDDDEEEDEDV